MKLGLLITLIILNIGIYSVYSKIINLSENNFLYIMDDPYIHLQIAKNFAETGVFGVESGKFSSASSSPLWTFLLSFLYSLGLKSELVPLFINLFMIQLIAFGVYKFTHEVFSDTRIVATVTVFILLSIPSVPLVFNGMEHILHIAVYSLCCFFLFKSLQNNKTSRTDKLLFLITIGISCSIRYESLSLGVISSIIFALRKQFFTSFLTASAAFLPVIIWGLISISNGWFFFPASVSIKAVDYTPMLFKNLNEVPHLLQILDRFISTIISNLMVTSEVLVGIFLLRKHILNAFQRTFEGNFSNAKDFYLTIFIGIIFSHILAGKTGWFFRYEAYLITFFWLIAVLFHNEAFESARQMWKTSISNKIFLTVLLMIAAFNIIVRSILSNAFTPTAARNMYQQDWQMKNFISQELSGKTIAVNDIGMVNYFTNAKFIDLWGLANYEIAQSRIQKKYNTGFIDNITNREQAEMAFVYDSWFLKYGGLPPKWIKLCDWKIQMNVVAGDSVLNIYSIKTELAGQQKNKLLKFMQSMPDSIQKISKCY